MSSKASGNGAARPGAGLRVGLFGGSFDPIHAGHVETVRTALEALQLDRVIYLPTATPPHKPDRRFAAARARFAMVELALLDDEDLWVSPFELTPGEPAYTIDTVMHFRNQQPEAEFVLLIGGDSLAKLHTWRRWREIVEHVPIAVLVRPGWRLEEIEGALDSDVAAHAESGRITFVENEPLPPSSTELRARLAADREIPSDWLDPRVLKYIRKYSLYR